MPGFCLKDTIYGIWYIIGNWVVTTFWGDILEYRDRLNAQLQAAKEEREQLVDFYEGNIQDLTEELISKERRHLEDYSDLQVVCNALRDQLKPKPKAKKKDPSKVAKPIKPRARKKVK